jgi:hypothetical protein
VTRAAGIVEVGMAEGYVASKTRLGTLERAETLRAEGPCPKCEGGKVEVDWMTPVLDCIPPIRAGECNKCGARFSIQEN